VRRGLAPTRERAQAAIREGRVTVGGAPADKAARLVAAGDPVEVAAAGRAWASRGGHKLDAVLSCWPVEVAGRRCLDAGASTGGFTDVLLARGAAEVWAVDVGRGQLLDRLARDERVVVRDRTNVRYLAVEGAFDVVVADLSFISLRLVAPVLAGNMAAPGAHLVWLVKPQFEAGREEVARGRGVVGGADVWREALLGVGHALESHGAAIMGVMRSPLRGADGNVEFLLWARAHAGQGGVSLGTAVDGAVTEP
jgi:23S rRNA (cytidine1920-2'-O)/16S rRNA (cytidine1409-2'-O)-methyltransferase